MNFIVALLAVLAVGSVSATPALSAIDVLNNVSVITGILETAVGQVPPETLAQLKNIGTVLSNRIFGEINKFPQLCNLTDNPGLLGAVLGLVLTLLGLADDLGKNIGNIIGFLSDAIGQIKSILPASADIIGVAYNNLLCGIQAFVTSYIADVNTILNPTIITDLAEVRLQYIAGILVGQTGIHLFIENLKIGPLGSVFGEILNQSATYVDQIAQQLLCLADKIVSKGIQGLSNALIYLKSILATFVKLLLVCPI